MPIATIDITAVMAAIELIPVAVFAVGLAYVMVALVVSIFSIYRNLRSLL